MPRAASEVTSDEPSKLTNGSGTVVGDPIFGVDGLGNDIGGTDFEIDSKFEIYSAELSQIIQTERQTFLVGAMVQSGNFRTHNVMDNVQPAGFNFLFLNPPADVTADEYFSRSSVYGYYTLEPINKLWLTAGLGLAAVTGRWQRGSGVLATVALALYAVFVVALLRTG